MIAEGEKVFNDTYNDGLKDLCVYYASRPDPESLVLKFPSVRTIVKGFYHVLVGKKMIEPIEKLERCEKERLWKMTEGLKRKERVEAVKGIYVLGKIKG